ncbi:hypothetical protein IG631_22454 [Alternaria alternata]|nr:hypothetical protein IG631_22454 [Alternaria alternata]
MSEPSLNTASGPQSRLPPRDVACADEAPRLQVIRLKGDNSVRDVVSTGSLMVGTSSVTHGRSSKAVEWKLAQTQRTLDPNVWKKKR